LTNLVRKWSSIIFLQPHMTCSGWMTTHRRRPKDAKPVSFFLQIWLLRMPILNQRLGSFPTESRAIIFPQYRQDYPFSWPINRGRFQGLKKEKIGSKVNQKYERHYFFLHVIKYFKWWLKTYSMHQIKLIRSYVLINKQIKVDVAGLI